jgi:hypothetical protein
MTRYKDPGAMPTFRDQFSGFSKMMVLLGIAAGFSKMMVLLGIAAGGFYLLAREGYVGVTVPSPSGPIVVPIPQSTSLPHR